MKIHGFIFSRVEGPNAFATARSLKKSIFLSLRIFFRNPIMLYSRRLEVRLALFYMITYMPPWHLTVEQCIIFLLVVQKRMQIFQCRVIGYDCYVGALFVHYNIIAESSGTLYQKIRYMCRTLWPNPTYRFQYRRALR
jgi:hypothetical protein